MQRKLYIYKILIFIFESINTSLFVYPLIIFFSHFFRKFQILLLASTSQRWFLIIYHYSFNRKYEIYVQIIFFILNLKKKIFAKAKFIILHQIILARNWHLWGVILRITIINIVRIIIDNNELFNWWFIYTNSITIQNNILYINHNSIIKF